MAMKIVLSTRNPSKAEQIKAIFHGFQFPILTLEEAGIEGEAIEDGETLTENALKKAQFVHERDHSVLAMADDTGIFIDALDGEPGVRAARWAGEGKTTEEITHYCLERMRGKTNRRATFETVVVLIMPKDEYHFSFRGTCHGILLEAPKVPPQPKMPYSPIFVPGGKSLVWAEMTVEEENLVSHRGKAFRLARTFLEKRLTAGVLR